MPEDFTIAAIQAVSLHSSTIG